MALRMTTIIWPLFSTELRKTDSIDYYRIESADNAIEDF